ncbi:MAG: NAD-dependent epimerase/dehydratase family protein [Alphaproteobacteria bacterium]
MAERALITGAAGFVGAALCRRLLDDGSDVTALVRPGRAEAPRLKPMRGDLRIVEADLLDADAVARAVRETRPDAVYHLAAAGVVDRSDDRAVLRGNVETTYNLADALLRHPARRLVHVASCFEYGEGTAMAEDHPLRPTNVYGAAKAGAHLLLQSLRRGHGLPVISLRLFTPYGPWMPPGTLIAATIAKALAGSTIATTEGRQQRDFVYIDDVAAGIAAAADAPIGNDMEAINLASGIGTPIRDVVETILRLVGGRARAEFGALPYRDGEMWVQSGDRSRAETHLNWAPRVDLEDGLGRTIDWFRAQQRAAA